MIYELTTFLTRSSNSVENVLMGSESGFYSCVSICSTDVVAAVIQDDIFFAHSFVAHIFRRTTVFDKFENDTIRG